MCLLLLEISERFNGHKESWGQFVDVKINAVEVLRKEIKNKKKEEIKIGNANK